RASLEPCQLSALGGAAHEAYVGVGISADPASHSRPAPLLADLQTALEAMQNEVASGLASRLRRYVSGSLAGGLFAGQTNVALNRRLVVFNVQMLEDELRPVA